MFDWCKTSGSLAAAAKITGGRGQFVGIIIALDATNPVTLTIWDGLTAAGTQLTPTMVIPTSATVRVFTLFPPTPIKFSTGLYVNASVGAGAFAMTVLWR